MTTKTNTHIQEAIHLLNHSGFAQFSDVKIGEVLPGDTAVVQPLHIGNMLIAYLISERDTYRNIEHEIIVTFMGNLKSAFNDSDLQTLCFVLTIPYENLAAKNHDGRIQELITYGQRHGRLSDLTAYCRRERPHIAWPDFPVVHAVSSKSKDKLAVVVCINRLVLQDVADFLTETQKDCDYLLLTTMPDYSRTQWLPEDQKWGPAVQDFYQTMQKAPGVTRHFFFAAPLPYVFAAGCVWSLTSDKDELYHWDGSKYVHVMTTSRQWRN